MEVLSSFGSGHDRLVNKSGQSEECICLSFLKGLGAPMPLHWYNQDARESIAPGRCSSDEAEPVICVLIGASTQRLPEPRKLSPTVGPEPQDGNETFRAGITSCRGSLHSATVLEACCQDLCTKAQWGCLEIYLALQNTEYTVSCPQAQWMCHWKTKLRSHS